MRVNWKLLISIEHYSLINNQGKQKLSMEYLVFSAGSIGGIAYTGALQALQEECGIDYCTMKGFAGCSIGSIFALLCCLNYSCAEMKAIMLDFEKDKYISPSFIGLIDDLGMDKGQRFIARVHEIIRYKTRLKNVTFKQLWCVTGKKLVINASCLERNVGVYYSVDTFPEMLVVDAVRRSISIPFLFTCVPDPVDGCTYVDGGLHDPLPCKAFPQGALCLVLKNKRRKGDRLMTQEGGSLSRLLSYTNLILNCVHRSLNQERHERVGDQYTVHYIHTGVSTFDFDLSKAEKLNLMKSGYDSVVCLKEKLIESSIKRK